MWKNKSALLIIFSLIFLSNSIYIPLGGKVARCMIVYSVGETETVKLDINFPELPQQQSNEYYQITWKNTESNEVNTETIRNGRLRKQLTLTQNVIYDLCIRTESYRDYGISYVDYNAHNLFAINHAQVKVPDNLLKEEDITTSYINADTIERHLDAFITAQSQKTKTHAQIFRKTNLISLRMVQISVVEVVIIIGAGCYQFWVLWNFLKSKQYI